MLKIGDFSKLARISIRMLRYYDSLGLLMPESIDDFTGYRYYSESQLPLANRINALRDMGFGLADVREILAGGAQETLGRYLEARREELSFQERDIQRKMQLVETAIEQLGKEGIAMAYDVTRKVLPEMYVASVRQVIPTYEQEGDLWRLMRKETTPLNMKDGTPSYTLAVFFDGEYKEENVDVEVQKNVVGTYPDTEHVKFKTVPAVEIASATYKGNYDGIAEVNGAVANWIRDNGYEICGLGFNIYHVSPHESANPEDWVTEVCYPIRKQQ